MKRLKEFLLLMIYTVSICGVLMGGVVILSIFTYGVTGFFVADGIWLLLYILASIAIVVYARTNKEWSDLIKREDEEMKNQIG